MSASTVSIAGGGAGPSGMLDGQTPPPIFLYSGYRSSSTWLWQKFRNCETVCAYYEPLNEQLATLTLGQISGVRPDSWRSHHPASAAYMAEYVPLLKDGGGVESFPALNGAGDRIFGRQGVSGPLDADVAAYIELLVTNARRRNRVPVISCTRILGLAAGLRTRFGGYHILLVRNLFQQWNSFAGQAAFGNFYFLDKLYRTMEYCDCDDFIRYIAQIFSPDSRKDFADWISDANSDKAFCYFIAIHLYLIASARRSADIVVDVNRLSRDGAPYRREVTDQVRSATGLEIDLSDARENVDYPLRTLQSPADCRAMLHQMTDRLHDVMDLSPAERSFVDGLLSDVWEEQERFTVYTAGASELLAQRTSLIAAETALRVDAERKADQARAEAEALAAKAEAAEQRAVTAEADVQQHAAAERVARVEAELAAAERTTALEQAGAARSEAAALGIRLAEQASVVTRLETELTAAHLAAFERRDQHVALAREAGRLEGQLVEIQAARDDLSARLARVEAALADATAAARQDRAEQDAALTQLREAVDRLRAHIRWREGQLIEASALLAGLPAPTGGGPGAWSWRRRQRQPAVSAHGQAVASWRAGLQLTPASASPDGNGDAEGALFDSGVTMSEQEGPITTVPRLLAPHDADFIRTAYQAVLGRAPDAEGGKYYLTRLRAGAHKLEILRQLRRSDEGRGFIPGVAGLDRAIKRHRWATLPVLGPIVRLVTGAEGDGAMHRRMRVIANDIGHMASEQAVLLRMVQDLLSRPATAVQYVSPPPPPAPVPGAPPPPTLDAGSMADSLDSGERRLLKTLRLLARTKGAPA